MRLPTLTRLPKNKRFNFQPRYYDPIKEEIVERTSRIKSEINQETSAAYRENISAAFRRRSRAEKKSGVMQFGFVILFLLIFIGFLTFGEKIFLSFLLLIPIYIWIKMKRRD
ncbi:MAG: hypothetical protein KFF73_05570 [Cyclobacteriaceae bacterium]|nr:hypothetical protein [Cyclobacteriaceae bacterium]